jgi:hypothetical protein
MGDTLEKLDLGDNSPNAHLVVIHVADGKTLAELRAEEERLNTLCEGCGKVDIYEV